IGALEHMAAPVEHELRARRDGVRRAVLHPCRGSSQRIARGVRRQPCDTAGPLRWRQDPPRHAPAMLSLKANVRNGRLVLDEPTELPEGEERGALHAALAEGIAQDDAGDAIDADELLAHLRARSS